MSRKSAESTGSKKKRKRSDSPSLLDGAFFDLEIRKYCPKRIFDVLLINGSDGESTAALKEIIEMAKKYEDVSCITFITYEDVLHILEYIDYNVFPEPIRNLIIHVLTEIRSSFRYLKPENYPANRLAILMKIKLIEVMCRHRKKEIVKLEKRSALCQALESLTKECRKGVKEDKSKHKERIPTNEPREMSGYLETESDVVFDDDIFNHVWFYIFQGFFSVRALNHFIYLSKIAVTATIKFCDDRISGVHYPANLIKFWKELDVYLYGHKRTELLENTLLMNYSVKGNDNIEIFEDLWHSIKGISNIKLQHLNYIRHLKIYEVEHEYEVLPLHCLTTYTRLISNIPLELTNEIVILSSTVEEACCRLDDTNINDKYSFKDNISKISIPFSTKSCSDPCDVSQTLLKTPAQANVDTPKKIPQSVLCYYGDYLTMTINMYKPIGKVVNDLSLDVLKKLKPFYLLDYDYPHIEIIHKHNVAPSQKTQIDNSEAMEQFLELLIVSNIKKEKVVKEVEEVDFKDHLEVYDAEEFRKSMKVEPFDTPNPIEFPVDITFRTSAVDYYWTEKYPSHVMLQKVYKVQQDFAYMDSVYCSDVERLLVTFHDDLDDFGINTMVYDESICTPVCLRDFCKYVVVSAANWINNNKPPTYVRKIEESEQCPGTKKIRKSGMFPEYRYLLETNTAINEHSSSFVNESRSIDANQNNDVTFDEMIGELENYPCNKNLMDECLKAQCSKDFLAYDFAGTRYFAVKGARTIFASHDNVKITVENTKLIEENKRCTIDLKYLDNHLILHSHETFKESYSFHWILEDDTIILFEIQKAKKRSIKIPEPETIAEEEYEEESEISDEQDKINAAKMTIKSIDEEYLKQIVKHLPEKSQEFFQEENLDDNIPNQSVAKEKVPTDIYQGLCEAIAKDLPVYKIRKNYETINVKNPVSKIPMVNMLERVLHNSKKSCPPQFLNEAFTSKKFISSPTMIPTLSVFDEISFRITLPNGIHVSCYPSQIRENLIEIKQEQVTNNIKSLRLEEFRLFTRDGYILIKKIDGSITLLMSNGNQLDYEKPDTNKDEIRTSPIKQYHCKTYNDYRKKLNKIMKHTGLESSYYISRRGALETKKGYVINKDLVKILDSSKLPFLKSTLLSFEGTKTVLSQNKVTQKKLYYTVSENDFVKEEISFERKDGLKCILEKSANRIVEFTDGTRISTSVAVSPDLVDGYVYINLYYKYEHPYYAAVSYGEDDLMQIFLNNNIVLEKTPTNNITLYLDNDVTTMVDADIVRFVKKCNDCNTQYNCVFDITPFHTNTLDFTGTFAHAEDSYGKHFFVDYAGNCKNNAYFISGPLNTKNCNHLAQNVYKRLFSINKNLAGKQFFTDGMIDKLKHCIDENTTVVERKGANQKCVMLDINTRHYESFAERYMCSAVKNSEVVLTKYKQACSRPLYYCTNRFVMQVLNSKKLTKFLNTLLKYFENNNLEHNVKQLIVTLLAEKEEEMELKRKESKLIKSALWKEADKKCRCLKERITFAAKITKWQLECDKFRKLIRESDIPFYFMSEFCQTINP